MKTGQKYHGYNMTLPDDYIRRKFKKMYGSLPDEVFEKNWNKWAGPVRQEHEEYKRKNKNLDT